MRYTPTRVGTTRLTLFYRNQKPVHPHSRGDNRSSGHTSIGHGGTPPLAWGQPNFCAVGSRIGRYTPTRVGTTHDPAEAPDHSEVHPHSRGDNRCRSESAAAWRGTPPLAWGQLDIHVIDVLRTRYTPTRVGTTKQRIHAWRNWEVHPHSRGDNSGCRSGKVRIFGTPPLAWGQLDLHRLAGLFSRYTPTRVGTTARSASSA